MKKYIQPQIELIETEVASILAGSDINIGSSGANPEQALVPEIDIVIDDSEE